MLGRLTLNVISSDSPGETADSAHRYQRSCEVGEILKTGLDPADRLRGRDFYHFGERLDRSREPFQTGRADSFYFGGYSRPRWSFFG